VRSALRSVIRYGFVLFLRAIKFYEAIPTTHINYAAIRVLYVCMRVCFRRRYIHEWKCVPSWEQNKPAFQLGIGKIKRAAAARTGDCVSLYFKFNPFLFLSRGRAGAFTSFVWNSEHIFVAARNWRRRGLFSGLCLLAAAFG
jgi:hypothetical protein